MHKEIEDDPSGPAGCSGVCRTSPKRSWRKACYSGGKENESQSFFAQSTIHLLSTILRVAVKMTGPGSSW